MFALLLAAVMLPVAPHPAAPFPKIITDAPRFSDVAPGIRYGSYRLVTRDGPLQVRVLAVDLHNPYVRVGTALAEDHLVSHGETVSSMAQREHAVAGINGDYFDINQTNQPLNILIRNGSLIRMPMQRWALAFDDRQEPQFAEFNVWTQAVLGDQTVPLKTINDWAPPGGGTVLITPDYGVLHPAQNVTEYTLQLVDGTPPFATYRVSGVADSSSAQPPGYYFAVGAQAYGTFTLPSIGDTLAIQGGATPSLQNVQSAIGGGPLLVKNGQWYADPDGPNRGEFLTHMPATGGGITAQGTLLLFEIDGREPARSIGLLQPQIASLMIAFGVVTGMQFDGGGSSTLVARLPGEHRAHVRNAPSDGTERRVGDALLLYSTAPYGPPAKLFTYPDVVRALPGARVKMSVAVTDAFEHTVAHSANDIRLTVIPASAGRMEGTTFVAGTHAEDARIDVRSGSLHVRVPVHVTTSVARAQILPLEPALPAYAHVHFRARAFDATGYPIALPKQLPWSATGATIDDGGDAAVLDRDATVRVQIGDATLSRTIVVGTHTQPLSLSRVRFATAPAGEPGAVVADAGPCADCVALRYDFTGAERAAYADTTVVLPRRTLGLEAYVYGDANGEVLRAAVNNAINERFLYTVAKVDWRGWRRVELRFPPALPQPITLKALYVINRVGPGPAVHASGAISIRDLHAVVAGRPQQPPK